MHWFDDAITCQIAVAQLEGSDQIVDSRVTCVVSENLLGESSTDKRVIKEQSGISREQIRFRGPFESFKAKQGVYQGIKDHSQ